MKRQTIALVLGWGLFLALGTLALQWLDYRRLSLTYTDNINLGLVALGFLGIGIYLGARVLNPIPPTEFDGNPQAVESLKISPRELTILQELAAGHANKEIAQRLGVSPNTVKTHIARLFEKLGAKRRTDAIHKARSLGIVP
jgi:DNA-binding CsgD family transcriptional regulator